MTEEPSVLDYVKARLRPWRGPAPQIPSTESEFAGQIEAFPDEVTASPPVAAVAAPTLPWAAMASFGLALAAQLALEPHPGRSWEVGAILYLLSFVGLIVAVWRSHWDLAPLPEVQRHIDPLTLRLGMLFLGVFLGLAAFWLMGSNRFTALNFTLWLGAIFIVCWSFWLSQPNPGRVSDRLLTLIQKPRWQVSLAPWSLLVMASIALVLFFRLHQLNSVPPQMVSDQAEKLLDVWDVLQGQTSIFFVRNTGREPMQFYLTAAIIRLFDTGITFLSLKIGTVLAGLATLPFIYLIGKEIGNRRIALIAMTMAGIAYWPNVLSRVGLRFPLYPLFAAATLYFLLRGIRRSSRNDFILAGLFLGIGLHGYTPIRILPFVVVLAVALYLLHRHSAGLRRQTIWSLIVLAFVSLMVFLPLLRYSLSDPDMFAYRAFSRLGTVERPLPEPAWQLFLNNTRRALTMYSWDNGQIWPVSVTHRPALDIVSGALFHAGVGLLLIRYLRRRHWLDLFLLLAIPLLMMPSILSFAYPAENPAPNRASGAMIPVFLIAAIALDGFLQSLKKWLGQSLGSRAAWGLVIMLLAWSANQNYNLVFREYKRAYDLSSWNTTEMGEVIRSYANSVGSLDSAWVVAYPHWADTRLVGMHAGNPTRDFAITTDLLDETIELPGPKLFVINMQDAEAVEILRDLYPEGWLQHYDSQYEFKDFFMFVAPPSQGQFTNDEP